ncbi:MAG: enoyl-CoA hydratase/isomerase family protein [Jatrophihabitans sp.]
MAELLRIDRDDQSDGAVATIRLDRPPMNALNLALQEELRAAAAEVSADDTVRAVVVYGGERVFAAGADVKEMVQMDQAAMASKAAGIMSAIDSLAQIPKPVVAAVTGYALGGGCELALTADRRISADNAKWGQPEVLLGVLPGMGGTQRLARLIGPAKAKDLIYTGRFVDAAEALDLGLVDEMVPAAEVYEAALTWARQFAGGAALALRAAKHAIDAGLDGTLADGLAIESGHFAELFGTEDRTRGMTSFVERGAGHAEFVGR